MNAYFSLEDISTFRAAEGARLSDVTYFFWMTGIDSQRFLLYVELLFESEYALILTSGEDTEGIAIAEATDVIEKARILMQRNEGKPAVQQMNAANSGIWQPALGQPLKHILLTKNEENLYLNDAILLDFDHTGVIVALHDKGGLAITPRPS